MDYNSLKYLGFDWDHGNRQKVQKHGVSLSEIESIFISDPMILPNKKYSIFEKRYIAVGQINERGIFIAFTIRRSLIRVISARYMHKEEKVKYDNFKKEKV